METHVERPGEVVRQQDLIRSAHEAILDDRLDEAEQCLDEAERLGRTATARLESRRV